MTAEPKKPVESADADGFARRWSKRKHAARAGVDVDAKPLETPPAAPAPLPSSALSSDFSASFAASRAHCSRMSCVMIEPRSVRLAMS